MTLHAPAVAELLKQIGEVGRQLSAMGATEGAAGNISICMREMLDVEEYFPRMETIELPEPAPGLVGATLIVTGSGRRLREIADDPTANLACIVVQEDGTRGKMFTSADPRFKRVTSEFNSHLAVHHDQMRLRPVQFHAVLHAQPRYITYLSHLPNYQDEKYFNSHLLRWQPETIMNLPEGIGVLPFLLPGSRQLMIETLLSMRDHQVVVWSQHGIIVRGDESIVHALDLVEYVETAAQYEALNLATGEKSSGIAPESLRAITEIWNVRQKIF
jgi:rhamnulose-1-phosphate aldolase